MPRLPACLVALLLGLFSITSLNAAEKPGSETVAPPESFKPDQREHWAYQPAQRPALPSVKHPEWVRNPIDTFILADQAAIGLRPSPEADRIALIRRLAYDLTGLPPSPEEVSAFLLDHRGDAYERIVDKYLASPAYGIRWAQHWLDLAHYADSNGFELDAERPDAWRYRDWVVSALNSDMPYDRFVALQIAGDEIAPGDSTALIATGFGRCGPREVVGGNIDPAVRRQSELTEVTGTVGSVFLGLTMACARCHDHKFDALPTTDYYRLQAFFAGANFVDKPIAPESETKAFAEAQKSVAERTAPFRAQMAALEVPYRKALTDERHAHLTSAEKALLAIPEKDRTPAQKRMVSGLNASLNIRWEDVAEAVAKNPKDHAVREQLKRQIHAIELTLPRPPASAMALIDESNTPPETFVFRRGETKNRGPKVAPRPPGVVLVSQPNDAFALSKPSDQSPRRRAALAAWLTRPDNPLTARVIANRLWQHHFGRGIVATPSDFGVRGESPSHPELLDWLATELISNGWRLKPIHRLMVTSAAYRQTSRSDASGMKDDPENSLVWRQTKRRLDAEGLRDAMLAVTGELNPKMGGPGVLVPIEPEVKDLIFTEAEVVDLWPVTVDPTEHARRSLYLFRKRNVRYPMFDAFDAPDTQSACPQRQVSTHALQALVGLNGDFAVGRARALAGRLYQESPESRETRIDRAYRLVLCREPSPHERAQAASFLDTQSGALRKSTTGRILTTPTFLPDGADRSEAAALVDFCLAMINRNEFLYIP
jgi:hypothetical protein